MDNEELLKKMAALPEPDFLHAGKLSDPLGSNTSYRASTVARLIEEAAAAERKRCAEVCAAAYQEYVAKGHSWHDTAEGAAECETRILGLA